MSKRDEESARPIVIEHRTDRFRQVLSTVVSAILIGAIFYIASKVDTAAGNATTAAKAAAADGTILVNCTTPGHQCYERAQAGTGQALASINVFVTAAAICARVTPFDAPDSQFEDCIVAEVAKIAQSQQHNPKSPFYIPPSATTTTTTTQPHPQSRAPTASAPPSRRTRPRPTTTTTTRPPSTTTTTRPGFCPPVLPLCVKGKS